MENTYEVTRSLLRVMVEQPPDFVLVQTRSPLVTRDIELLQQLGDRVRVSMTVETDLKEMRKQFTPKAPPIQARMLALRKLKEAGIATQAAISPVLPCSEQFADQLIEVTDRMVIDDYFQGDGAKGKRTEKLGIKQIYERLGLLEWYHPEAYLKVVEQMKRVFPEHQIYIGQKGFLP